MTKLNRDNLKRIKGSAKDILIDDQKMYFEFSDRYSIYDWGEMPDPIEGKGHELQRMAVYFFNFLESRGFKTHYLGEIDNLVQVRPYQVFKPELRDGAYDYTKIKNAKNDYLIPLEVIFRFGIPQGSSLLKASSIRLKELGLESVKEGATFERPLIEFSTKLEPSDRYLLQDEAIAISGLSQDKFNELKSLTCAIAQSLKQHIEQRGLELWDGKFEFALDSDNQIVLIDSVGVDELRLTIDGSPLSKECLRQFYAQSQWRQDLIQNKHQANWKQSMLAKGQLPEKLSPEALDMAKQLYHLLAEVLTEDRKLEELQALSRTIQEYLRPKAQDKTNIVIMASGNGSNAQNLIETAKACGAQVKGLICDRPDAFALKRGRKLGVPTFLIEKKGTRKNHEQELLTKLIELDANWLLLAGYMRILTQDFLSHFWNAEKKRYQIINIHPSLLPAYPGLNSYEKAFADGVKKAGVTVHFLDEGVDTGPVIEQASFLREEQDDFERFVKKGQELEYKLYSRTLEKILTKKL